jgi:hypothetical protein
MYCMNGMCSVCVLRYTNFYEYKLLPGIVRYWRRKVYKKLNDGKQFVLPLKCFMLTDIHLNSSPQCLKSLNPCALNAFCSCMCLQSLFIV